MLLKWKNESQYHVGPNKRVSGNYFGIKLQIFFTWPSTIKIFRLETDILKKNLEAIPPKGIKI